MAGGLAAKGLRAKTLKQRKAACLTVPCSSTARSGAPATSPSLWHALLTLPSRSRQTSLESPSRFFALELQGVIGHVDLMSTVCGGNHPFPTRTKDSRRDRGGSRHVPAMAVRLHWRGRPPPYFGADAFGNCYCEHERCSASQGVDSGAVARLPSPRHHVQRRRLFVWAAPLAHFLLIQPRRRRFRRRLTTCSVALSRLRR